MPVGLLPIVCVHLVRPTLFPVLDALKINLMRIWSGVTELVKVKLNCVILSNRPKLNNIK